MGKFSRVALATALMVPLASAPVWAQQYKADFGVNGGGSWYSAMLDSETTGLTGTDTDDVKFKAGWLAGTQLTFWLSPKLGLRANGTFSERPIISEDRVIPDPDADGSILFEDVNLWTLTGDLLFRFATPNETWQGSEFLPYLALGIGGKWHNPAGDNFDCIDPEETERWSCAPWTHSNGRSFALGEQKVIAGLVGLGADWRLSPRFALRMEINDRIYKPQVYAGTQLVGGDFNLTNGDELVSDIVHEVGGQIGLHMLFGLEERQVVAVQPLPPPPPAAAPAPAPARPAPPREENIMVCVVDPTSGTGIRMQPAVYRIEQRDTLVTVGGNRVALNQAIGTVMVARNADWYVAGRPLLMEVGTDRVEFIPYGTARQVQSSDLEYVGTVNGYPMYIEAAEAADVRDELDDLRDARMRGDLGDILEEEAELNAELADVQYWYVPLDAAGCVFQPLQRSLPVIKKDQL